MLVIKAECDQSYFAFSCGVQLALEVFRINLKGVGLTTATLDINEKFK